MPKLIVTTATARVIGTRFLEEDVGLVHLDTDTSAEQLIERLVWALKDAEDAEKGERNGN